MAALLRAPGVIACLPYPMLMRGVIACPLDGLAAMRGGGHRGHYGKAACPIC